jgi:hypothetical protein
MPHSNMRDETVLVYYIALEPGLTGNLIPVYDGDHLVAVQGETEELGGFKIRFVNLNLLIDEEIVFESLNITDYRL